MYKFSKGIQLGFISLILAAALLMCPSSSEAILATFNDFSTGFDVTTDTGSQTQNGITFQYSDDQIIDLRTAANSYLDIINTPFQFGTFTLDFIGVPSGHYLEIDVDGFFLDVPNNEILRNFNVLPDSIITNGALWTGAELLTTTTAPGTATFRYDTAPGSLSMEYGSTTNWVAFNIRELRIAERTGSQAVPEPATIFLISTGFLGVIFRRKMG
ncbi:MAG: PEP-CTERM sorting domain-containing protein [Candidatus Omnitrophica bacterium]|nr:PEP-CTERM sorting domain-containing protein [Candidatus Omnitrophota bacterium]